MNYERHFFSWIEVLSLSFYLYCVTSFLGKEEALWIGMKKVLLTCVDWLLLRVGRLEASSLSGRRWPFPLSSLSTFSMINLFLAWKGEKGYQCGMEIASSETFLLYHSDEYIYTYWINGCVLFDFKWLWLTICPFESDHVGIIPADERRCFLDNVRSHCSRPCSCQFSYEMYK